MSRIGAYLHDKNFCFSMKITGNMHEERVSIPSLLERLIDADVTTEILSSKIFNRIAIQTFQISRVLNVFTRYECYHEVREKDKDRQHGVHRFTF